MTNPARNEFAQLNERVDRRSSGDAAVPWRMDERKLDGSTRSRVESATPAVEPSLIHRNAGRLSLFG